MDRLTPHIEGGYTLQDRINSMVTLIDDDITPLCQIIDGFQIGYRMNGADLDQVVRESLMLMLEHGARPIQGANDGEFYWTRITRFGDDPAAIADGLIAEWRAAGVDPEHDGVWMAMPGDVEFRLGEDAVP